MINTENNNTWLLTYNPTKWNWDDYAEAIVITKRGNGYLSSWNCANHHAKVGDRVFLIKLGDNSTPKGIIATGFIISDFWEGENFDQSKEKKIKYVDVIFTSIIDYRTDDIITIDDLKARFPKQKWDTQSSGIIINSNAAQWLIDNWNKTIKMDNGKTIPYQPVIWKISHGKERTGIPEKYRTPFEKRGVVVVHSKTLAKGNSSITQGQSFIKEIKSGDYFYLCYSNDVILFGQFTDNNALPNPELSDGWYERSYRTIKASVNSNAYKDVNKWWTPNNNSTCIKVDDNKLFEKLILEPYFGLKLTDLNNAEYYDFYSKEEFLKDVFITEKQYDTLAALLKHKKNIILQGAPGVGKTFTAKRLAYAIMGEKDDSRIEFVQFHQSYSYEDFIMGYRPTDDGSFELKRGVFYRFCDKARNDPDRQYFFIIDEINRGNLSKIFGEMLMLIEADKRGDKLKLTYQKEDDEPFSVPDNLYIIGMMNTADRSLAMIDYALRRRFSFFEMSPGFDSDGFKTYSATLSNELFDALIRQIKLLNKDIEKDSSLGKGFCIGHSYFCNLTAETCTDERLREIVEYDIIPMLKEYWFDDKEKVKTWSADLRGLFNDD